MFIKDPCGIACMLITYIAVFYADYVVIKWIILQSMQNSIWGPVNVVGFNTIVFLLAMAHLKAVLSDPGTVPLPQARLDFSEIHSLTEDCDYIDWTVCTRCETYRPPRAHHCRICQRCIRRMDHHCPWINNCVGERNQKYFIQFLIYVAVLAIYALALIIISWLYECKECSQDISFKQSKLLHCIILLLESLLFGMFVVAILVEQIQAILGDETYIEHVQNQGPYRPQKPKLTLLSEVCGRQHPLLWLLPCTGVHRKYNGPLINHEV